MASNADCASIHVLLPERVGHSTVGSPNPEDSVSETSYDPTLSPRLALLGKQEHNQRSDGATSAPRPSAISKPRSTQTTAKSVDASLDREARSQDAVPAIDWPSDGQLTLAWIERLQATFTHATWKLKPEDLPQVFPIQVRSWCKFYSRCNCHLCLSSLVLSLHEILGDWGPRMGGALN
jgi:hypothetical protein